MPHLRILVAEGDLGVRELLAELLRDEGYEPVLTENGQRALELVEAVRPALVLLDTAVRGLGGLEVARRLRANPATRALPVLGMSTNTRPDAMLAAGCCGYVAKPFRLDDVLAAVRLALTATRPRRQDAEIPIGLPKAA